jgi:hypothetical protein
MNIINEPEPARVPGSPAMEARGEPRTMLVVVRIVLLFLAIVCAGFILRQTLRYGVQVPMEDQWDYVYDYQRYEAGEISLASTLLLGAGEHLNGVKTASILLWRLFGINHRLIMVLGWLQAVAFIILMALVARQALPRSSLVPWVVLSTSSFFVFNTGAFQFWMWGIPHQYTIVPFLFLAAAFCAQIKLPVDATIVIAAVAAALASCILGSGMLLWGLLPVVLVTCTPWRELLRHRIAIAVYGLSCLLMIILYAYKYTDQRPDLLTTPPATLRELASFFLAYTGNLVLGFPAPALISWEHAIGAILLIFVGLSMVAAFQICRGKPEWTALVIWSCLAAYELLSGGLVTLARHSLGLRYLVEASRYVLASCFLPAATIAIATTVLRACRYRLPDNVRWYSALLGMVTAFLAICLVIRAGQIPGNLESFRWRYTMEHRGKVAVTAANLVNLKEYRIIYSRMIGMDDSATFRKLSNFIAQKGALPPMWNDDFIQKLARSNPEKTGGSLDQLVVHDGQLSLSGWAYLKPRKEPADAVIILAIPPSGPAKILNVAFPFQARPDVATFIRNPDARDTGWVADIAAPLPEPGTVLRCFAYDADSGNAYPLMGDRTL